MVLKGLVINRLRIDFWPSWPGASHSRMNSGTDNEPTPDDILALVEEEYVRYTKHLAEVEATSLSKQKEQEKSEAGCNLTGNIYGVYRCSSRAYKEW